jgi:hypothetical protein
MIQTFQQFINENSSNVFTIRLTVIHPGIDGRKTEQMKTALIDLFSDTITCNSVELEHRTIEDDFSETNETYQEFTITGNCADFGMLKKHKHDMDNICKKYYKQYFDDLNLNGSDL